MMIFADADVSGVMLRLNGSDLGKPRGGRQAGQVLGQRPRWGESSQSDDDQHLKSLS